MNKIRSNDYENKPYPNSFNLMSETYSVKNNLRFFFFCVYYLSIPETNANLFLTKEQILDIYIKAKKHTSALSKFARVYKFKKYKTYEYDSDLSFISLDKYSDSEKIKIIQNKTIYNFKLKDLINLWKISLNNSDNMFPMPKPLKNPFTNIVFDKHQLYNIYFKYGFGPNFMPEIITLFFKSNLNFHIFKMESHEKLQINAINKYVNKGTVVNLYDYLVMMFHDFRYELEYVFLKPNLSVFRKLSIIKSLERFLKYFLYYKFITNPLRQEYYAKIIRKDLKKEIQPMEGSYFIVLNTQEILRYENRHNPVEYDENTEEIDVEDDDEILQPTNTIQQSEEENNENNINLSNTAYRRSSYPRLFPPIVLNTYENVNLNVTNPFEPTSELPRTPQTNGRNNISDRLNLGFR